MSQRYLSAEIFCDDITPNLSMEPALAGIDIVKTIAPWIQVTRRHQPVDLGLGRANELDIGVANWPNTAADISVILTNRDLVDTNSSGQHSVRTDPESIGLAMTWYVPRSERIAVINTNAIKRPEHIVAHEVGHLLGVQDLGEDSHCENKRCLMFPLQFPAGKADRTFCECCSGQLHDNSLTLRRAKSGRLAVFGSRIF